MKDKNFFINLTKEEREVLMQKHFGIGKDRKDKSEYFKYLLDPDNFDTTKK